MKGNPSITVSIGVIIIVVISTMQLSSVLTTSNGYAIGNAYALSSVDRSHIRDALSGASENTGNDDSMSIGAAATKDKPPKLVLQTRIVDSGQKTVPAGVTDATIASCLPDEVATGGGHQVLVGGLILRIPTLRREVMKLPVTILAGLSLRTILARTI